MRWEPAVAVLAMLALAVSAAWLQLDGPPAIAPTARGPASGAIAAVALQPPVIGPFAAYDVNADNPFVPWHVRVLTAHTAVPPAGPIPPVPPADVPLPPAPPLLLPDARPGGGDAPRAIGFVRAGIQDAGLLVRLPGEQRDRRMLAGERAGRWTLLAIEDGNTAVFADVAGRRYRQLIGR